MFGGLAVASFFFAAGKTSKANKRNGGGLERICAFMMVREGVGQQGRVFKKRGLPFLPHRSSTPTRPYSFVSLAHVFLLYIYTPSGLVNEVVLDMI
jgi:hypothetical protein